jgi:hypothetical protein
VELIDEDFHRLAIHVLHVAQPSPFLYSAVMLRFALALTLLVTACKNDDATPAGPASSEPVSSAAPPVVGSAHGGPAGNAATATQTPPRLLEKLADGRVALGPFSAVIPSDWLEKPSTSSMRTAQFQLPASGGGEAEVIVYYFGESGAGNVQDNINRWLSQFKQPDGKPSSEVAKVEKGQVAGQEATIVSVSGRYVAPAMPGGEPSDKPDQSLLAAIVPSPRGPYYFRLIGPQAAVSASAPRFREMLGSLKLQ